MTTSKNSKKPARKAPPTIQNRRARYDYFIEEEIEAGIVLQGSEVKSIRAGRASINDAYATEKNGEIWIINMYVAEYDPAKRFGHLTRRPRKLLLGRKQIKKLAGRIKVEGYTLVPLNMYFKRGFAKLKLGLGKGKKAHDKRESIKEREASREMARGKRR